MLMAKLAGMDREGLGRGVRIALLTSLAALSLAACASVGPDGAGRGPVAGQSGLRGTNKPYQVDGRWYYPHAQPDYNEVGQASWYGQQFHNHHTADGEIFDQFGLSAAHKTLPLPCIVEVTNLDNGKRMRLRVNDRGPFVGDRLIDVSRGAAEALGFRSRGLTRVRVRYIGPASALPAVQYASAAPSSEPSSEDAPPPRRHAEPVMTASDHAYEAPPAADPAMRSGAPDPVPPPSPLMAQAGGPLYAEASTSAAPPPSDRLGESPTPEIDPAPATTTAPMVSAPSASYPPAAAAPTAPAVALGPAFQVQAAAFSSYDNAQRAVSRLTQAGPASIRSTTTRQGQTLYRVVLAGYPDAGAAEAARAQVAAAGFGDARVIAPF